MHVKDTTRTQRHASLEASLSLSLAARHARKCHFHVFLCLSTTQNLLSLLCFFLSSFLRFSSTAWFHWRRSFLSPDASRERRRKKVLYIKTRFFLLHSSSAEQKKSIFLQFSELSLFQTTSILLRDVGRARRTSKKRSSTSPDVFLDRRFLSLKKSHVFLFFCFFLSFFFFFFNAACSSVYLCTHQCYYRGKMCGEGNLYLFEQRDSYIIMLHHHALPFE